jgi:hypothetical protein
MKQKILILIPLLITAGFFLHGWIIILTTDVLATWRHYLGLVFFLILVFLFFTTKAQVIVTTGLFLLLATFNLLAITPTITTTYIGKNFGTITITTPPVQLLSLGIFAVYFILNLDSLINIYLDYKEAKSRVAE